MVTLQETGYVLLDSIFNEKQMSDLKSEFDSLKATHLENKQIIQPEVSAYDAGQQRFEIINPPLLNKLYKSGTLKEAFGIDIQESMRINNRCGYYFYLEGSYIKPHFDHILTDCMLLVCLSREYGQKENIGGILKLYIPKTITFNRSQQKTENKENCRIEEIDLKAGSGILVAGGHILHECTPIEKGGTRLVCGMGYTFHRSQKTSIVGPQ